MKKRILSLFLAIVMTLALIPTAALAASKIEIDENGFGINDGVLVRYDGPGGDVVIPDGVAVIGSQAFLNNTAITSVVIPDSVTTLERGHTFHGCTNLRRVRFGNGVTEIPEYTFYECPSLTEVVIPDSVTKIGVNAFNECTALERVDIPASVECIEEGAFADCSALREVVLYEGLTTIDRAAFIRCAALERIEIPASVTRIGNVAFMSCSSLGEVVFHDGLTEIGESAFQSCTALERVDIPASVEKIGKQVFSYCTSLKEVNIANPDADVDSGAFYASGLTSYTQGGVVKTLGKNGTQNDDGNDPETVEDRRQSAIDLYKNTSGYRERLENNRNALGQIDKYAYQYTVVTDEVQAKSDELCRGLSTDTEKVTAIHAWMVENIYYDKPVSMRTSPRVKDGVDTQSPENVLDNKRAVCEGYSNLFQALCWAQKIPCVCVLGDAGEQHAWNAVQLDGKWLWVDSTWDTFNTYYGEGRWERGDQRLDYFLCSTEFLSTKHSASGVKIDHAQKNKELMEERAREEKERFNQELNDHVSPWARSEVATAYATGLYSASMRTNFNEQYTRPITRAEFCVLVVDLVELAEGGDFVNGIEGISINDYLASKGLTHIRFKSRDFPFTDIKSYTLGSTHAIPQAYSMGIINGTSRTTFSPNDYLTREQAATMLMRAGRLLGLTTGSDPIRFRDNGQIGDWAKEGVDFVTSYGIMNGVGDNNFDPQGRYTREQALVTIVRMYDAVMEDRK